MDATNPSDMRLAGVLWLAFRFICSGRKLLKKIPRLLFEDELSPF
jgi:hypothetical protein